MKFQFSKNKNKIKLRFLKKIIYIIFKEYSKKKLNFDWSKYPMRYQIINEIIASQKLSSYLEIGCKDDANFSRVKCGNKVGVDPVSGGNKRMTSDEFFISNSKNFDLIFIDGDHRFNQSFRDLKNSIKFLNPGGFIILHDCLPRNIWEQSDPPLQYEWTGQVWKTFVKSRTIENIDSYTILADCGLGVIIKRPNSNILKLTKEPKNLRYSDYIENLDSYMRIKEFNIFKKEFLT